MKHIEHIRRSSDGKFYVDEVDLPNFPPLINEESSLCTKYDAKTPTSRKEHYQALIPECSDNNHQLKEGSSPLPEDSSSTLEIDCSNSDIEVRFLPSPSNSIRSQSKKFLSPCPLHNHDSHLKCRRISSGYNTALSTLQRYHNASSERCHHIAEYVFLRDIGVSPSSTVIRHNMDNDIATQRPNCSELPSNSTTSSQYEQQPFKHYYPRHQIASGDRRACSPLNLSAYRTFYQSSHPQTKRPCLSYGTGYNRTNHCNISPLVVNDRYDPLNKINITVNMDNSCKHTVPRRPSTPNEVSSSKATYKPANIGHATLRKSGSFDTPRKTHTMHSLKRDAKGVLSNQLNYSSYTSYSLPSLSSTKKYTPCLDESCSKVKPSFKSDNHLPFHADAEHQRSDRVPHLSMLEDKLNQLRSYAALEIEGRYAIVFYNALAYDVENDNHKNVFVLLKLLRKRFIDLI